MFMCVILAFMHGLQSSNLLYLLQVTVVCCVTMLAMATAHETKEMKIDKFTTSCLH